MISKVDDQKIGYICKNKTLNSMSKKLLKNELENQSTTRLSYSLMRKEKNRPDDENKCVRINSNQINLLRRQTSEIRNDEFVNLIQTTQDYYQAIEIDYSLTNENRFTVETPATLDLESKIKAEADDEDKKNALTTSSDELNNELQTEKEIQTELNSIITKLNNDNNSYRQTNDNSQQIESKIQNSVQCNSNNQLNNQQSLSSVLNEVSLNNQLNYDFNAQQPQNIIYNQEFINNQAPSLPQFHTDLNQQTKTSYNSLMQFQSQDDVDFGLLMPQLFENLNTASRDQFDSNQSDSNYSNDNQPTAAATNYQLFTDLTNTSNSTSLLADLNNDFSPIKDIPAEKLTFSNISKSLFLNLHDNATTAINRQNEFHFEKLPDLYDFDYQPDSRTTSSSISNAKASNKKLNVKELTKQKSKRKKKAKQDLNFKRLDIKKKTYARGHKKFNVNKYKKDQWKKLQQENKCFKCGETDHWAKDCTNVDQELKEIENTNNYDELEELASDEVITNSAQPFNENDAFSLQNEMQSTLKIFGFHEFRTNQQEVIERILMGKSVLMISSTGSGKSLCYQLPAYIYSKLKKYITIVVTPLISLMEDQILNLPDCLKAVCLNSSLNDSIKKENMNKIQNGNAQILFVSPEYILTHQLELNLLPTIAFVCIDEAHCLSEWSNNFRPSYLQFFKILKEKIKINTFLTLTATANKSTTKQIVKNIGMNFENDVIGTTRIPENLVLTISRDSDKDFALISLLKSERFFNLKSIIIYCSRREITEKIATLIRIEMQKSKETQTDTEWTASAYHAGLSYQERKRIQKSFINGKLRVIVATIAFGMGINKSDIDGIIHFSLPATIENYIQEIGRAGRDKRTAQCHLFLDYDSSDLFEQQKHIYANGADKLNVKKLVSKLFKPCKCLKLRQITKAEEEQMSVDIDQDNSNQLINGNGNADEKAANNQRCLGHENAFTTSELTEELDIKEETLLTILIYLEMNLKNIKIKVLNKTNSTCILSCYKGGSEQLEKLAKKYPFIGLPLAQLKKDNSCLDSQTVIKFSFINVASMLGQPSREIWRKLKGLEWRYEQNRKYRSNIRIAFEDPSFHVITPGDLNEQEQQQIIQMILNYSKSQEILEVKRLKQFYEILKESSQSKCTNKINASKGLKLKKTLNDYFNLNRMQSVLVEEDDLDNIDNLDRIASQSIVLKNSNNSEIEDARRDIRDLFHIHSDQYFSSRAITRILQGISSPKYSAEIWGKDKRFWRKRIKMDFNLLFKIANEELVRIKCSV